MVGFAERAFAGRRTAHRPARSVRALARVRGVRSRVRSITSLGHELNAGTLAGAMTGQPGPLLTLQRAFGNEAVARLLAGSHDRVPGAAKIQRCPGGCDCSHEEAGAPNATEAAATESPEGLVVQKQDVGGDLGMAPACGIPSTCPADFCTPYPSKLIASWARDKMAPVLLAGIAAKVNPRVVPLWYKYLYGGSGVQDLSSQFGGDFTRSVITGKTTDILGKALADSIETNPPVFPPGESEVTVDAASRISNELDMVGRPEMGPPEMNFWKFDEIPGNIAGGIGKTQTTCPAGARPGPFDDERTAEGTARVIRNPDGTLTVKPQFKYVVKDTIDLCPGNCGAKIEQIATVPLSRFEATGISGDIPFVVRFPSPSRSFVVRPSAPPPKPPTEAFPGTTTASYLRIRTEPNTSAPIVGKYPRGTRIEVHCQTRGEVVDGNPMWNKTDRGYVADRYVRREDTLPPRC